MNFEVPTGTITTVIINLLTVKNDSPFVLFTYRSMCMISLCKRDFVHETIQVIILLKVSYTLKKLIFFKIWSNICHLYVTILWVKLCCIDLKQTIVYAIMYYTHQIHLYIYLSKYLIRKNCYTTAQNENIFS